MSVLDEQFDKLKDEYPSTEKRPLPSGAVLITISDFSVPDGWTSKRTTIKFLAPLGYPQAKPDCFWASAGLRVEGSPGLPQATGEPNEIPEAGENGLWFSWHAAQWNPNRDTLRTYVKVIEQRLKQAM